MSDEEIKFNFDQTKKVFNKAVKWFSKDKVKIILPLAILAALVVIGIWIRTQNLSLLHDATTGKYIPLALDPFYWLREAQTILQPGGLPAIDPYRKIVASVFSAELLPRVIVGLYTFLHWFNSSITLQFADVIYPVIAFALGVVAFYFLVYKLTKSKVTAVISSAFLTIIPTYLYRTMAGFSDHDALGTFAFLITILVYTFALSWLNKENKNPLRKNLILAGIFGVVVGFLSDFTLASWGGIFEFIPMIIPLSFTIFWILKMKDFDSGKKELPKFLVFYISFFVLSLFSGLIYGFPMASMLDRFLLTPSSLLAGLSIAFVIIDFIVVKYVSKIPIKNIKKNHILLSLGLGIFLGILVLAVHKGVGSFFSDIVTTLLHPFGTSRVGLTVAENAQPYISDWLSQTGPIFFWLFFAGLATFGINISRGIKNKKRKGGFIALWTMFIAGLLLTRLSATSILNGTNFISKALYFGSILAFLIYCIYLYRKDDIRISPEFLVLFSLMVFMLIAARGAARLIFTVTPFACLFVGYLIFNLASYAKKAKDDLLKMVLVLALIGVLIASIFSFNNLASASITQAKYTGPSADYQWQYAMQWVRNNTPINATFAHWWDYGYWVEYLGNRSTIADGGHFEGSFRDHLIGRYLLTEPNPNMSLSFMKSNNVSYLLIDPSDLGKYPAYSIIGSDNSSTDRYSSAPIMPVDSAQTQVQGNSTVRAYQNVVATDADILYNSSQGQVFIPQGQAYVVGVIINETKVRGTVTFSQPEEVIYYNNQRIDLPMRYLYYNGQLLDFRNGYASAAYILPALSQTSTSYQIDYFGSMIYLSPKVFSSLFAQLYLMDDPFNKYPTITLAHAQDDQVLQSLKAQGFTGNFVYYGGNFDGPIKIWNVKYPSYILSKEEFTRYSGTYAEFDNLTITKGISK